MIKFQCEHCGHHIVLIAQAAKRPTACPYCGKAIVAPTIPPVDPKGVAALAQDLGEGGASAPGETAPAKPLVACPFCAKMISFDAARCDHCGKEIGTDAPTVAYAAILKAPARSTKSPAPKRNEAGPDGGGRDSVIGLDTNASTIIDKAIREASAKPVNPAPPGRQAEVPSNAANNAVIPVISANDEPESEEDDSDMAIAPDPRRRLRYGTLVIAMTTLLVCGAISYRSHKATQEKIQRTEMAKRLALADLLDDKERLTQDETTAPGKRLDEARRAANPGGTSKNQDMKQPPQPSAANGVVSATLTLPNGAKMELMRIKAGTFMMGSPENEMGRFGNEKPHSVTLTHDYWIGKYEVTQGQWMAVMGNNPAKCKKGDAYPVEMVSWEDARWFCGQLNQLFGKSLPPGYRFDLPTEAQWEYACRAGTTSALNNGRELTAATRRCLNYDAVGWGGDNSGGSPHPVGEKRPNAWGLYDMHGNVWELCRDQYEEGYAKDPEFLIGNTGATCVLRGGGWRDQTGWSRSARRIDRAIRGGDANNGFRIALVATGPRSPTDAPIPNHLVAAPAPSPATPQSPANVGTPQASAQPPERPAPQPLADGAFPAMLNLPDGMKLKMVPIKAGSFMMGSPTSETGRVANETQHQVTLTRDYWLGKYEVTQGQWKAMMGGNPSRFPLGNDYPVEQVSWNDAKAFCDKLNERFRDMLPQGYRFDLPTEAQWEYACRAGTTTGLYNGRDVSLAKGSCPNLDPLGWYNRNSGGATHPVGQKQPNPWGLYDMLGNVKEWCQDWHGVYPVGAACDPVGPSEGQNRVYRGGQWDYWAWRCRAACRDWSEPGSRTLSLGFRLALVPVQTGTTSQQRQYQFNYRVDDKGNAILCQPSSGVPCVSPKPEGVLIVPRSVDGHTITGIDNCAFENCDAMTRIVLPPHLEQLPTWISGWITHGNVFKSCTALASIEIAPTNPKFTSENGALYSKDKTTLFAYPKNRDAITFAKETTKIEGDAFNSCTFTVATIPDGITNFGAFVFSGCRNLEAVEFPSTTKFIGHRLFLNART